MVWIAGETRTPTGAGFSVTVMGALAEMVESATEVAVNVIVAGWGTFGGAVYVMAAPDGLLVFERVPQALLLLQFVPDRFQVTPLFCASF